MEDLASYLGGMDPAQRQTLLAEQLRTRQQGDYQQRLGQAFQGDPRMRMMVMAAMLSGNKNAMAATEFANTETQKANAPRQLGNTGFFNPQAGEFVENPIYTGERRDAREQRRWEKELADRTARDNLNARLDQQARDAETRAQIAREAERGRNERAADSLALRQTLATLAAGRTRDAAYERIDRQDDTAWSEAQKAAGKRDAALDAERGSKPLSGKELTDLADLTAKVRGLGSLAARAGETKVGASGLENTWTQEAGATIRRFSPLAQSMASRETVQGDEWWADYRAQFENLERNELFGSALTDPERKLWNQANLQRGMTDEAIRRNIAARVGIANQVLARRAGGQAANGRDVDAIQATTEGFYTAPPRAPRTDPTTLVPPDRARRLQQRGVIPEPSPTGSLAPNRSAPPPAPAGQAARPAPIRTPDGWTVSVEQ